MFKTYIIKNIKNRTTACRYRAAIQNMHPFMTLQEEIDWCLCTHIMEYKVLLKRIEKRWKNEKYQKNSTMQ